MTVTAGLGPLLMGILAALPRGPAFLSVHSECIIDTRGVDGKDMKSLIRRILSYQPSRYH